MRRFTSPLGALLLALAALFWLPEKARADFVIYSNFGPGQTYSAGGYSVSGLGMTVLPPKGFGAAIASSFTPTRNFLFDSVELPLVWFSGTNSFIVALMSDAGGRPGTILESFAADGLPPFANPAIDSFISTTHAPLNAGTTYWIVAMPVAGDTAGFWLANTTGATGYSRTANDSLTWQPQLAASPAFEVDGMPVPAPPSLVLAALGAILLLVCRCRGMGQAH
jgi:hypothetical protein